MDNLAGFPNNISINKNKKFVYSLPSFIQPKPEKFAMILEISSEGEILQSLFDSKGKSVTEAGAVIEHKGYLYLGYYQVAH